MHPGRTCSSDADHDELSRSPSRVKAESQIPAPVGSGRTPTDTRERQFEFGRAAAEPAGQSTTPPVPTDGIGLEVARGLAANDARVVLSVRNTDRGETAAAAIGSTSPGASLRGDGARPMRPGQRWSLADALGSRLGALHLLINNASALDRCLKLPKRRRIVFSGGLMPAWVHDAAVGEVPCSATKRRTASSVARATG
jgi:short subunit dehydrogenase